MRIDAWNEDQPELIARLRLLYNLAATQRTNADDGLAFASIRLDGDSGQCTVIPAGCPAVDCHVDCSLSSRDALRDTLAAQGVPLRATPSFLGDPATTRPGA